MLRLLRAESPQTPSLEPGGSGSRKTLKPLLGGPWVVMSGVISRETIVITHIRGLMTPLITTLKPLEAYEVDLSQNLQHPTKKWGGILGIPYHTCNRGYQGAFLLQVTSTYSDPYTGVRNPEALDLSPRRVESLIVSLPGCSFEGINGCFFSWRGASLGLNPEPSKL